MNDREQEVQEILSKANEQWDEIEKELSNRQILIETNHQKIRV